MFEAYVAAEQEAAVDSLGGCEGVELGRGREREVPVRVMRELESVLAVRSEARERRKEEKRRRRREGGREVSPQSDPSGCVLHEQEEATNKVKFQSKREQVVMATADPGSDVLQSDWMTQASHTDHTPTVAEVRRQVEHPASTGTSTDEAGPDSTLCANPAVWLPGNLTSELASMAAAVAAGSQRSKVTEVFGSNHDDSSSD